MLLQFFLCSWSLVCHTYIVMFPCIRKWCCRLVLFHVWLWKDNTRSALFSTLYVERVCCCVAKSRIYGTLLGGSPLISRTVIVLRKSCPPLLVIRLSSWVLQLFPCMLKLLNLCRLSFNALYLFLLHPGERIQELLDNNCLGCAQEDHCPFCRISTELWTDSNPEDGWGYSSDFTRKIMYSQSFSLGVQNWKLSPNSICRQYADR